MSSDSKAWSLNKTDFLKLGKGLLLTVGGCVLAFATDALTDLDQSKQTGAMIAGFGAVILNFARKFTVNHS